MKTYFSNGTMQDIDHLLDDSCHMFYIQDLGDMYIDRYVYPHDSIKYNLANELVSLYDKLRILIFSEKEVYYQEIGSLPDWMLNAGLSSECAISTDDFSEWIQQYSEKCPNLYRHQYLFDCQFRINTIQNLLCGMENDFLNYFIQISHAGKNMQEDAIIYEVSWNSECIVSLLANYFVKAYSILDILCKIGHEFQNPQSDFSSNKKMRSSEVLWGARKKLQINGTKETLFEECNFVQMIEALRNEVVHNGTWELHPKIYFKLENGEILERYLLFPDIDQGHLATVKNRKHFFGKGTKVNDILPQIHSEFQMRLLNTISIFNNSNIQYVIHNEI